MKEMAARELLTSELSILLLLQASKKAEINHDIV